MNESMRKIYAHVFEISLLYDIIMKHIHMCAF